MNHSTLPTQEHLSCWVLYIFQIEVSTQRRIVNIDVKCNIKNPKLMYPVRFTWNDEATTSVPKSCCFLLYLLNLGGAHVKIYVAQTHLTFIPLSPTPEPHQLLLLSTSPIWLWLSKLRVNGVWTSQSQCQCNGTITTTTNTYKVRLRDPIRILQTGGIWRHH